MYNRYIPQPDGTYRRNRIDDPVQEPQRQHSASRQQHQQSPSSPPPPPKEEPQAEQCGANSPRSNAGASHQSAGSFLRQLLPANFDTGDLIVIVLLLLIAGDCPEERSNALLTLALYFIM